MNNIRIAEKIYGLNGDIERLDSSEWFCPKCKSKLKTPVLFSNTGDFDGATDVCLKCKHYFQIRQIV